MKRLLSGGTALVMAVVLASVGATAVPAHATEGGELEDLTDVVLGGLEVNITQPTPPTEGAIAEFVTAVLNAINSREQAITDELNGMRVVEATAALRTVVGSRNMLRDPNMSIRRDYVRQAAEAAYLAESLFDVTSDPAAADELAQVGMAAYALYLTGRIAADQTRPQPEADSELISLMLELIRFLLRILGKLPSGDTSDAASEAKDELEEAVERVRNRDPGGGGPPVLEYVALGDSYASGSGTGVYNLGGPIRCNRSSVAYSGRLNGALTLTGRQIRTVNAACHGALVTHFNNPQPVTGGGVAGAQSAYLSSETTGLVTVSMGGNDLGFNGIVEGCLRGRGCGVGGNPLVPPAKMSQVRGSLTRMYLDILERIRPDGRLVVLTYPNIVPPTFMAGNPCTVSSRLISKAELEMLDQLVKDIEQMIHDAAIAVGSSRVHVVDMSDAFTGHWICSVAPRESWANAIQGQLFEWFHPNIPGHQSYLDELRVVLRQIGILL